MSLITVSKLGRMGRFGNQMFQYSFLRAYAHLQQCDYQSPTWVGQWLFGLTDPPLKTKLPAYHERRHPAPRESVFGQPIAPPDASICGHDYIGYCQFHTSWYRPCRQMLRDVLTPIQSITDPLDLAINELTDGHARDLIGLHLRRGDTGRLIYYLTPNDWYLNWLDANWRRFRNPILFIATEQDSDISAFAEYSPVVSKSLTALKRNPYSIYNYLKCDLRSPTESSMDWFPDWYVLSQCPIMAIGESTFSFSAAMYGRCRELWRSMLSTQNFEKIDPWDAWPLVREDLRDFPDIPNTSLVSNPKWLGGELCPQ